MKGHVRERPPGSGNWYVVLEQRDPSSGKRKRKWISLEAPGKRQAQIECARLISELSRGTYLEPTKTTLAQYLDRWLDHARDQVSPKTFSRYDALLRKNVVPLIGSTIISKLKAEQINGAFSKAHREGRRDGTGGLSARTVLHMHRVLKLALNDAVKWELLIRTRRTGPSHPRWRRQPCKPITSTRLPS